MTDVRRLAMIAVILFAAAGCAGPVENDLACTGFSPPAGEDSGLRTARADTPDSVAASVERLILQERGQNIAAGRRATVVIDYLVMSTGGQYGAFSSGFLKGWAENTVTPRPDFQIVTGASAGGIVAPLAFAGTAFDDRLSLNAGIGSDDVVRQRPFLELIFSNSIMDVAPLEAKVREAVDGELVAELRRGSELGGAVWVGAVNLDTTAFEEVDLARIASADPDAERCIEEAVLATSAIPGLFPPRRINGHLYADAGLRDHLFLNGVREGIKRAKAKGARVVTNAYIIINGDLRPPSGKVRNRLGDIAIRSMAIASDQGLRKSVLEVLRLADETEWNIHAITARDIDLDAACGPEKRQRRELQGRDPLFDTCVTQTLFEEGREMGRSAPIAWLSADELRALTADR